MKPNTPIREFIMSQMLDLEQIIERKKGKQLIFNADMDLVIENELIFHLWDYLHGVIWGIWNSLYPGSETQWYWQQDFPPHLHPEYHDLPPFGSYPLALIK